MLSQAMEDKVLKLTDTQLMVLSNAGAREDGAATVPAKMNKTVATKLAASLVDRKLMREIRAKPGMPVWRKGEDDRPLSLVVTSAGRKMIHVEDAAVDVRRQPMLQASSVDKSNSDKAVDKKSETGDGDSASTKAKRSTSKPVEKTASLRDQPRPSSKRQLLVDLLSRPDGATIDEMVQALGWLPHTTRAELTRLRHLGLSIARTPREKQASLYSLAAPAATHSLMKVGEAA